MKKQLLTAILLLTCAFSSKAQQRMLNLKEFNTWSLQGNVNLNYGHTDIVKNDLFYTDMSMDFGYGLRATKFLTHNIGVSLDGYRSKLSGSNKRWDYNTKVNYQLALLGQIQTGNIHFLSDYRNLQLYGYLGYGTINYTAELTHKQNSSNDVKVTESRQVIPVGMGIKYHARENVTVNMEYSLNNVNGDYLDGFSDATTERDNYSRVSLGVSYTFGKKDNDILEWHDPRPRPVAPFYRKDTVVIREIMVVPDTNKKSEENFQTKIDSSFIDSVNKSQLHTTIHYDFNKYKFAPVYRTRLDDIALEALNSPGYKICIESFADTVGTEKNNEIIVSRRANEIAKHFYRLGLEKTYLEFILHNEQDATMPTDAENRKSHIYLIRK